MKTTEYIIVTLANFSKSELSAIDNISLTFLSHARVSKDGTKCTMKVVSNSLGNYPSCINTLTKYSLSEIKDVMQTEEWQQPIPASD